MIRVLIADDHAVVRQGLKQILAGHEDITVVGEAGTTPQAYELLQKCPADVLLLDIAMPGRSGLELMRDAKKENPGLAVLVLSGYPEEQLAIRSLRAGASGYLNKEVAPDVLVTAVRTVASGRRYVTPAVAELMADSLDDKTAKALHESLSEREYRVLQLIGSGKTVSEIAVDLALSVKTVSTYRARILEKMKMNNNAELTRYAIEQRLV